MKLFRHGPFEQEKPGVVLDDGRRVDASSVTPDYDERFFAGDGLARLRAFAAAGAPGAAEVVDGARIGSCVARPSKIVCIGLNYLDHIRETGAKTPSEPVIFFKATTSLCGPDDDVWIPRGASKLDWEVELAVIVGKRAKHVPEGEGLAHVAGYALHNDYSEREHQLERGGQWVKGKSGDRFAPLGPWLVPADECPDIHERRLWLEVNGAMRQDSNTSNMLFRVEALIEYCSRFMTLLPGDVISTGTPPGVGLGCDPPEYLNEGDVVRLGLEGLGEATQRVVRER